MTIDPALTEDTLTPNITPDSATETGNLAKTASIISIGNLLSRVLGLAREILRAGYFGAGPTVDALNVATLIPTYLHDLMIGGLVDSSLIPVFSEIAAERREELWRLVSAMLTLALIVTAGLTLLVELGAPIIARVLAPDTPQALTISLMRMTVPAVMFLALSEILTALLFALRRFTLPAMTAAVFNFCIVAMMVLFHDKLDVTSMAVGLLIGAMAQVIVQLPALRDTRLVLTFAWRNTGMRRVLMLYAPIALGLLVDVLLVRPVMINLADQTGGGGISWMRYATTLIQLPQGLVATAISTAILPTLSVKAVQSLKGEGDAEFRATLAQGLRLISVLIIPATIGIYILAAPVAALLFQHGQFNATDTAMTAMAMRYYLLGLPFAAVDLLLVYAFYAQQQTLTPSIIGVIAGVISVAVAIALVPIFHLFALMIADSVRQFVHALISAVILHRRVGDLTEHGVMRTVGLALIGASLMGLAAYGLLFGIDTVVPTGFVHQVLAVAIPAAVGGAIYVGLITLMRVEEMHMLIGLVRRKLGLG